MEYYGVNEMREDERKEFLVWYDRVPRLSTIGTFWNRLSR